MVWGIWYMKLKSQKIKFMNSNKNIFLHIALFINDCKQFLEPTHPLLHSNNFKELEKLVELLNYDTKCSLCDEKLTPKIMLLCDDCDEMV